MKKAMLKVSSFVLFVMTFSSYSLNAQQVLSQSTSQLITTNLGTCIGADWTPGNTSYWRAYVPTDYGFMSDFYVHGVNFACEITDNGGTNPDFKVVVNAHVSSTVFPDGNGGNYGNLTLVATDTITVTLANNLSLVEMLFDTQAMVASTDEIVIEIKAESGETLLVEFRMAGNTLGNSSDAFVSAPNCILTEPVPMNIISSTEYMILDLVGDGTASVTSEEISNSIYIFPNPANEKVFINYDAKINVKNVILFDMTGVDTGIKLNNDTMDISELPTGIYILNIYTELGVITKKIIKE